MNLIWYWLRLKVCALTKEDRRKLGYWKVTDQNCNFEYWLGNVIL